MQFYPDHLDLCYDTCLQPHVPHYSFFRMELMLFARVTIYPVKTAVAHHTMHFLYILIESSSLMIMNKMYPAAKISEIIAI